MYVLGGSRQLMWNGLSQQSHIRSSFSYLVVWKKSQQRRNMIQFSTFVFFPQTTHSLHSVQYQSYLETIPFSKGGSQHSAWKFLWHPLQTRISSGSLFFFLHFSQLHSFMVSDPSLSSSSSSLSYFFQNPN